MDELWLCGSPEMKSDNLSTKEGLTAELGTRAPILWSDEAAALRPSQAPSPF